MTSYMNNKNHWIHLMHMILSMQHWTLDQKQTMYITGQFVPYAQNGHLTCLHLSSDALGSPSLVLLIPHIDSTAWR